MLQLENIVKSFQNGKQIITALNNVTLQINENDFVAVMGSSGSGKSTLMNVLGCLDRPCSGTYRLIDENTAQMTDDQLSRIRNEHIGFVFQAFHLLPKLNVVENVSLPLRFSNVSKEEAQERALELIDKVGLTHRKNHKPFELSGGQRQRVAIARALISNPSVILADEPTGNLDSSTSLEIMSLFTNLHKQGQTIVMVTHENDIAKFAHRKVVMRDGEISSAS